MPFIIQFKEKSTYYINSLRDQVIRWLLLINEQHPKPTSKYRFTHCKNDQQDLLIEFGEDLKKRFTIDDFKLIPKNKKGTQ